MAVRSMREIHINGETWKWKIGKKSVAIAEPNRTGALFDRYHYVDLSEFTGLSWDAIERMGWKNRGVQVTPQGVKDYILEHLI